MAFVIGRFPRHELAVRRLYTAMPEFKSLCEAYATACRALDTWKEDPAKASDYRQILNELGEEILDLIEAGPRTDDGSG
ncbi:hypothetical protein NMA58_30245 (plasmid) [Rhizobium sp. YTUHZ045]|uniref:hypothetical protein n=1 Tax=Rhizobium sp. YTUHZ045 TaxID=2962888 RepID=UPI003DA7F298